MTKVKSKYRREESELIDSMIKSGNSTFITSLTLVETSKIKGYQIYDCTYVDNGAKKFLSTVINVSTIVNLVAFYLRSFYQCKRGNKCTIAAFNHRIY